MNEIEVIFPKPSGYNDFKSQLFFEELFKSYLKFKGIKDRDFEMSSWPYNKFALYFKTKNKDKYKDAKKFFKAFDKRINIKVYTW